MVLKKKIFIMKSKYSGLEYSDKIMEKKIFCLSVIHLTRRGEVWGTLEAVKALANCFDVFYGSLLRE